MLIDANGKKQGIMQIEKALDKANKDNLDLVQVSPNDSDPICLLYTSDAADE